MNRGGFEIPSQQLTTDIFVQSTQILEAFGRDWLVSLTTEDFDSSRALGAQQARFVWYNLLNGVVTTSWFAFVRQTAIGLGITCCPFRPEDG